MSAESDRRHDGERLRAVVRSRYGAAVRAARSCCCSSGTVSPSEGACCCEPGSLHAHAVGLGYSPEEAASVPEGANLGLGCGNPVAIAALHGGETVLDLGSGAGMDCFIAAQQVGPGGHVIGVDMTPDMVARARENAVAAGTPWVEFRLGEIEHLPVADASVDLVMSNCVVNLSADKPAVLGEAFRVLKPGGRVAIADTVATAPLPEQARNDLALWSCCISGALTAEEWRSYLAAAGFCDIRIDPKDASRELIATWAPGSRAEDYVLSATIQATRPQSPAS